MTTVNDQQSFDTYDRFQIGNFLYRSGNPVTLVYAEPGTFSVKPSNIENSYKILKQCLVSFLARTICIQPDERIQEVMIAIIDFNVLLSLPPSVIWDVNEVVGWGWGMAKDLDPDWFVAQLNCSNLEDGVPPPPPELHDAVPEDVWANAHAFEFGAASVVSANAIADLIFKQIERRGITCKGCQRSTPWPVKVHEGKGPKPKGYRMCPNCELDDDRLVSRVQKRRGRAKKAMS